MSGRRSAAVAGGPKSGPGPADGAAAGAKSLERGRMERTGGFREWR